MAFVVKKNINGKDYFYLNESKREGKKVKSVCLAYLGKDKKEADKKAKEILKQIEAGTFVKAEKEVEVAENLEELETTSISVEELANFCKSKGFVFRSSDIYGGFSGFWDFGPLGIEMFNNLKSEWWNFFVRQRENIVGMEASVISHPRTWKASGHIDNFSDVMVYDKKSKKQIRVDHLIEDVLNLNVEGLEKKEIMGIINDNRKKFSDKGYDLGEELIDFNLMFKTHVGPQVNEENSAYLRGETAQGMFMDFKLIQQTSRMQLPFGIAQIGRCFRNEIAPRDFLFRSREFHIGEFEFFIQPENNKCDLLNEEHLNLSFNFLDEETQKKGKDDLKTATIKDILGKKKLDEWHAYWLAEQIKWFNGLGLNEIKIREHTKDELSHYSSATFDIDYMYPFGSKEVAGIANRGTYDLSQHEKESKESFEIFDEASQKKILSRVIEPTFGMERVFLALLTKAYCFDEKRNNVVLKLPLKVSPIKAAIFPIIKKPEFENLAREVFENLNKSFNVVYDRSGSIGRRYARNDEIGTPFCITIDDKSIENKDVTIRDRDTTKQIRVKIKDLENSLRDLIEGNKKFLECGKILK